jgi:hypothetical protein
MSKDKGREEFVSRHDEKKPRYNRLQQWESIRMYQLHESVTKVFKIDVYLAKGYQTWDEVRDWGHQGHRKRTSQNSFQKKYPKMKTKGPKTQFKSEPENNDAKLLYTLFVGNQPVIIYIQFSNAL